MQYAVLALLVLNVTAPLAPHSVREPSAAQSVIASGKGKKPSDAELRRRMIAESIEAYPGPCACPYQRASNGSQCGKRSAYSREGGYETLCYASDISDERVKEYRAQLEQ